MKKIMLFSRDPGAANCVIPVYKKLKKDKQYQADLYGKDFALAQYRREKITAQDITKQIKNTGAGALNNFLSKQKYDLVLTGTSANDFTDRLLWQEAQKLDIRTMAILDQWMNYQARFSWNLPGEKSKNKIEIMPDKICVMDSYARAEMIKLGFPSEKLIITGQPYFETITARIKKISHKQKQTLRKKLSLSKNDYIITFASEPILETYRNWKILGYNEITVLQKLLKILQKISLTNLKKKFVLLIKLHPRNQPHIFDNLIKKIKTPNLKIKLIKQCPSQELVAVSDLILGMSSMFIIESAIMNKPYLSVQIGLKTKDPFILSRRGFCKTILKSNQLHKQLKQTILQNKMPVKKFYFIPNASERISDLTIKILNNEACHQRRKAN